MNGTSEYHSVELRDELCKGCTICVTSCPTEAIRVQNGKAHILEERCIDCAECIRVCPHHAKFAVSNTMKDTEQFSFRCALTDPSLYTQFSAEYTKEDIHEALHKIGFNEVFEISQATERSSTAMVKWIKDHLKNHPTEKPLISSSCPAVVKLIQIRFPSLINNLLPFLPPAEQGARMIYEKLKNNGIKNAGIFFIAPCSAKMTITRSPLGFSHSKIQGVLSMSDIYLPLLGALKKSPKKKNSTQERTRITDICCKAGGEAHLLDLIFKNQATDFKWLSASGIKKTIEMLENIEDGMLGKFDFVELNTCTGGCIGGPLTVNPEPVSEYLLRKKIKNSVFDFDEKSLQESLLFTKEIVPRPSKILSSDFSTARKMMEKIEHTILSLPGLDCGSCGAPTCRALAEDIVQKNANIDDCVIIMKTKYEQLLFGNCKNKRDTKNE